VVVASAPASGGLVTTAPTEEVQPAFSADGRVAFASDRSGNYDIYATSRGTGGERIQLTRHKAPDYAPAWAPDSGWLAFVSERRGKGDIYVIQASESAEEELVTTSHADDLDPAWSPRGIALAFASDRAGSYDIWILRLGKRPRRVTRGSASDFEPAWSPDGHTLAFTRRDSSGNYDIYSIDSSEGRARRLTDDPAEDSEPTWSPDGKQIAFVSDREGDYDIYLMNSNGGSQLNFSNSTAPFDVAPSWKPPTEGTGAHAQAAVLTPATLTRRKTAAFTCVIEGTEGDDDGRAHPALVGTPFDDKICGHGGNDTIYGLGGNDMISGGEGRDRIFGGSGRDKIKVRDGSRDFIGGGPGRDRARLDRKVDKAQVAGNS
jgi:dipeptidyl aminopeptidase/acylaminoacyl peptidase